MAAGNPKDEESSVVRTEGMILVPIRPGYFGCGFNREGATLLFFLRREPVICWTIAWKSTWSALIIVTRALFFLRGHLLPMKLFIAGMDLWLLQDLDTTSVGDIRVPRASNWPSIKSETSTNALAFASTAAWEGLPGSQLDMDDDTTSLMEVTSIFSFEVLMMTPSSGLEFNSLSSALVTISMSRWEAWKIQAASVFLSFAVTEGWKCQASKAFVFGAHGQLWVRSRDFLHHCSAPFLSIHSVMNKTRLNEKQGQLQVRSRYFLHYCSASPLIKHSLMNKTRINEKEGDDSFLSRTHSLSTSVCKYKWERIVCYNT